MSYEALERELRTLSDADISRISQFIVYLKLKEKFSEFENCSDAYENALSSWRDESKSLFENPDDSAFMQSAFDSARSRETYKAKEIW